MQAYPPPSAQVVVIAQGTCESGLPPSSLTQTTQNSNMKLKQSACAAYCTEGMRNVHARIQGTSKMHVRGVIETKPQDHRASKHTVQRTLVP
jgi:hypothetical protein